jgi:protein-tyrosine phosphatase
VQDALQYPTKYTINGSSYLLIEFPEMVIAPNISAVLDQLHSAGIIPIVTHPERNPVIQKKLSMLMEWVERDCLVQVTAGSFLGRFGRTAAKTAGELMARDLVHVVASDAHDTRYRTTALDAAYEYIAKHYSAEHAETVLVRNPAAIISGGYVDTGGLIGTPRRIPLWRRFLR